MTKLAQLAVACSLMGMAAGCAPSATPPPTQAMKTPATPAYSAADDAALARALKTADRVLAEPTSTPTATQQAEAARVERAWPRCQFNAEKASAPIRDIADRQQKYFVVLALCVRASQWPSRGET